VLLLSHLFIFILKNQQGYNSSFYPGITYWHYFHLWGAKDS